MVPTYSYDPSTLLGQVRFHAADTDLSQMIFNDGELLYCLTLANNIPQLAAAIAFEQKAGQAAALAVVTATIDTKSDLTKLADNYRAQAALLRHVSPIPISVISPDPVFTFSPDHGTTPGSMDVW